MYAPLSSISQATRKAAPSDRRDDRLLLDEVDDRYDRRWLCQLYAEFFHDRPQVFQELVESLLAVPDIEHLKGACLGSQAVGAGTGVGPDRDVVCSG
jgi:hypothetical protein